MRRLAHLSDLHFGRVDPAAVEGLVRSLGGFYAKCDRRPTRC